MTDALFLWCEAGTHHRYVSYQPQLSSTPNHTHQVIDSSFAAAAAG